MPQTRQDRLATHKKQERTPTKSGVPSLSEMREGVPEIRFVANLGLVEYIKFNGVLYRIVFDKA